MDIVDKGGGPNRSDISDDETRSIESPSYEALNKSQESMDTSSVNLLNDFPSTSGTNDVASSLSSIASKVSNHQRPQANDFSGSLPNTAPRLKAYPLGSKGPFLVFFRPKGKSLNKLQIQKDLMKSFRSITEITSPSRNKLRVTVSDRDEANRIAAHELFLREYHVFIPSIEVECTGVVTEEHLTYADIMAGTGGFKNRAVPPVPVLDAKQMNSMSSDGSKSLSNSFRVTFSGSALPDDLVMGLLRLPVRLYEPTVMHCEKCQQLGHTAKYCCNKPRCSRCGEQHVQGCCQNDPKCPHCGQPPHDLSACPKFIERQKHTVRSLQQRSKRSYADILKKITPTVVPSAQSASSNNIFSSLPDNDQGSGSEDGEEYTVLNTGTKRKRAIAKRFSQRLQAPQGVSEQQLPLPPLEKSRSGGNAKKKVHLQVSDFQLETFRHFLEYLKPLLLHFFAQKVKELINRNIDEIQSIYLVKSLFLG